MQSVSSEVQYLASTGTTLSPAERANLTVSLPLLRTQTQTSHVWLWGRLQGVRGDYLVAQAFPQQTTVELERHTFISTDGGVQWELVPPLSDLERHYCSTLSGLFTGEKDFKYAVKKNPAVEPAEAAPAAAAAAPAGEDGEEGGEGGDNAGGKPSRLRHIPESVRVAYIVEAINRDTAVVPRGAFALNSQEEVESNPAFAGLPRAEAGKLRNYVHFRQAESLSRKSLLEREHLSASLDFADPLTDDIPRGCWSLQYDSIGNFVLGRSLIWPGYSFYLVPDSHVWGSCYIGNGQKNVDLGFML